MSKLAPIWLAVVVGASTGCWAQTTIEMRDVDHVVVEGQSAMGYGPVADTITSRSGHHVRLERTPDSLALQCGDCSYAYQAYSDTYRTHTLIEGSRVVVDEDVVVLGPTTTRIPFSHVLGHYALGPAWTRSRDRTLRQDVLVGALLLPTRDIAELHRERVRARLGPAFLIGGAVILGTGAVLTATGASDRLSLGVPLALGLSSIGLVVAAIILAQEPVARDKP